MPSPGYPTFTSGYHQTSSGADVYHIHDIKETFPDAKKPLLILLHGFPQNHLMWKHFVQYLPPSWNVMIFDLPGYGKSLKPIDLNARPGEGHSKRALAKDIMEVVDSRYPALEVPVIVYGHDRGARVAYRLALDYSSRVVGLGVLDIVPTPYVWDAMRPENGHKELWRSNHWVFLASPRPVPETLIGYDPRFYYLTLMKSWSGMEFHERSIIPEWMEDGVEPYVNPPYDGNPIVGACEDYRAGATIDNEIDIASGIIPGSKYPTKLFNIPLLIIHGQNLGQRFPVKDIWTGFSVNSKFVTVAEVPCGHFVVNEAPESVSQLTGRWLAEHWDIS